jgi:hypothetical protein
MGTLRSFQARRAYLRAATTIGVLAIACVGTALATGNTIHVQAPAAVPDGKTYSITLRGYAAHTERLYLFVDVHKCARNPSVEHGRASGFIWTVDGHYKRVSNGWVVHHYVGLDHACGYLQALSEPANSPFGVLARGSATYAAGVRLGH